MDALSSLEEILRAQLYEYSICTCILQVQQTSKLLVIKALQCDCAPSLQRSSLDRNAKLSEMDVGYNVFTNLSPMGVSYLRYCLFPFVRSRILQFRYAQSTVTIANGGLNAQLKQRRYFSIRHCCLVHENFVSCILIHKNYIRYTRKYTILIKYTKYTMLFSTRL